MAQSSRRTALSQTLLRTTTTTPLPTMSERIAALAAQLGVSTPQLLAIAAVALPLAAVLLNVAAQVVSRSAECISQRHSGHSCCAAACIHTADCHTSAQPLTLSPSCCRATRACRRWCSATCPCSARP